MAAAAMASSSSTSETTEETTGPLAGRLEPPAADANDDDLRARAEGIRRNWLEYTEAMTSLGLIPSRPPPKRWFPRLRRLWRLLLVRVHPGSVRFRPGQILDGDDLEILERRGLPSVWEQLAMNRQLMQDCLDHYNRLHPGNEYEPVLGNVSRNPHLHNGICWTHGNFIARKKRFGPLSLLLAPRAVFFYELAYMEGSREVVTCTPVEEPSYYTALGFPLWLATLRSGQQSETFCKTCYRRFGIPRPDVQKVDCGHNNVGNVCEMCCHRFAYVASEPWRICVWLSPSLPPLH